MANGELCKTCECQEYMHELLLEAMNPEKSTKAWIGLPSYRIARKWTRQQICKFFVDNGIAEDWIDEVFYDVIRCSGFSTTRKRDKKWVSFQKD